MTNLPPEILERRTRAKDWFEALQRRIVAVVRQQQQVTRLDRRQKAFDLATYSRHRLPDHIFRTCRLRPSRTVTRN